MDKIPEKKPVNHPLLSINKANMTELLKKPTDFDNIFNTDM